MCGIAGFLNGEVWRDGPPAAEALVRTMARTLAHRGPDGEGVHLEPGSRLAFSHRRLAIIDRSDLARQPMTSRSGRHVIVYNGEIFNFADMAKALGSRGLALRSRSDTEVLLESIEAFGVEAAMREAEGMFAFALWDRREARLVLARDQAGVKPLHFVKVGAAVAFASEIKALRRWPGFRDEIDQAALADYLRFGYVPSPNSIYESVRKVEPGGLVAFDTDGASRSTRFWSLLQERAALVPRLAASRDDTIVSEADQVVSASIERSMVADVPVGYFLSGGVDSTLIAATAARLSPTPLHAYSAGFEGHALDESGRAAQIAAALGCRHVVVPITPEAALDAAGRMADIFDEPLSDMASLPTEMLARRARMDVGVVLTGEGGDEGFAGYDRYRRLTQMIKTRRFAPGFLGAGLDALLQSRLSPLFGALLSGVGGAPNPQAGVARLRRLAAALGARDRTELYLSLMSLWSEPEKLTAAKSETPAPFADADRAALSDLDFAQLADCSTYLPDALLVKTDRATMAHGLEARVPLANPRLLAFALALPERFRRRNGVYKHLLRELCYRRIDRALVDRPKQGFSLPMGSWLRGPLHDWAEGLIGREALIRVGLFDPEPVTRRWRAHLSGEADWSYPLWAIIVAQDWAARHRSAGAGRAA